MPTLYTRRFSLKDSLSDEDVLEHWRFLMDEFLPAARKVRGVRSVKVYSGAGALRSDITLTAELDDAGVYERLLVDPLICKSIAQVYGAWDLKSAAQSFRREVTPELIRALSSTG